MSFEFSGKLGVIKSCKLLNTVLVRQYEEKFGNTHFRELLQVYIFTYKISQMVFLIATYINCFEKVISWGSCVWHTGQQNT